MSLESITVAVIWSVLVAAESWAPNDQHIGLPKSDMCSPFLLDVSTESIGSTDPSYQLLAQLQRALLVHAQLLVM